MISIVKKNSVIASFLAILTTAIATMPSAVNAQQIPRELTKILALGDSITEGFSPDGGIESYRFPMTYTLDAAGSCNYEMVGRRMANVPATGFSSPHEGYSGHGVEHFLGPLETNPGIEAIINNANPDVVLIHLGSNDMNRSQTVTSTIGELDQLFRRIWNINPDITIYVANVIPWFGSSNNPIISESIFTLGVAIRNLVTNVGSDRLQFVNVRAGFLESYMSSDGIHPNSDGDSHIAQRFLSAINANNDCPTPPDTIIASPRANGVTVPSTHTFTGSGVDVDGDRIQRVRIAIEDNNFTNNSNRWFNFGTGQFDSYSETVATLSNSTPTSASWSITATLPSDGDYQFYALAVDNLGNQNYFNTGVWPQNRRFFTSSDSIAPSTDIDNPATQDQVIQPGATLSGTASDLGGSGVDEVRVSVRNRNTNRWYIFGNGTATENATLSSPSTARTDWALPNSIPAGNYTLFVTAVDGDDNESSTIRRRFVMQPLESQAPTATITNPATQDAIIQRGTTFTGIASDSGGSGFDRVSISVRDRGNSQWFVFGNGTITKLATLTNPASTISTNWTLPNLIPAGDYTIYVRAFDNAGNPSISTTRRVTIQ